MDSLWVLAILLLLSACGTWQSRTLSMPVPAWQSKYQFDYKVTNGEPIGLVRVFDDGGSTYLQFRRTPPDALVVSADTTNGDAIIPHEVMRNYAVIRGVYRTSSIPAEAKAVKIEKLGLIAPMASMGPVILPKAANISTPSIEPEPLPVVINNRASDSRSIRQIRFRRNSALLSPVGRKALAEMTATMASVSDAEVRVRPFYPAKRASVRLAEARAKVIRQALIDSGIRESRVRISLDGKAKALVAEVEIRTVQSQATNEPIPVQTGFELGRDGALGVKFVSTSKPNLSTHI